MEFKKFILMGFIFGLIIGIYWTLKPLKDSIFIHLINKESIPFAKSLSVIALIPIVFAFSKLLKNNSINKTFGILSVTYASMAFIFSALFIILDKVNFINPLLSIATTPIGYLWYVFVESFGALFVSLFWALAADTTDVNSAKKGFPLIVAVGQIGGIIFPYNIGGLSNHLGFTNDSMAIIILGILTLCIIPSVKYYFKKIPSELLRSFHSTESIIKPAHDSDFLGGVELIYSSRYLVAIFAINCIYEIIITIFDFNFKMAAATQYSGVALSQYLSMYGSIINLVSFLTLMLGISNISRFFGIGVTLAAIPIIFSLIFFFFLNKGNSLMTLFVIMVVSRSLNYSLNNPAIKQLFIPTTTTVRHQSQAWMESFGSRISKEMGSILNMLLKPLQNNFGIILGKVYYLKIIALIGFPLIGFWLLMTFYLNKTYKKAIRTNKFIC